MSATNVLYAQYKEAMQRIADVRNATGLLQWDQETYLPPGGANARGRQISTLSELAHQLFTKEDLGDLLKELLQRTDLSETERRNVTLTEEDYAKNKKYPSAFVRRMAEQTSKTFHSWIEARKRNSFDRFAPDLSQMVALKREEAEILGYQNHPYDALLNEYEKGATTVLLDAVFSPLLPVLKELLRKLAAAQPVDDGFLRQHFGADEQWQWGMHLIKALHFDFEKGRQDRSEHPFSISFSPSDVRITTRIDEEDFGNMTWSCIHEAGHALYEQGLPSEAYGLPGGEACSYSLHESQSRLWENHVGRGFAFWQYHYPPLQHSFPLQFQNITAEQFYKGINKVQPSLVRTEADEISYHFHVYIRYELEKKLIEGSLEPSDVSTYWNEQYKDLMGITVPDDKQGALQDVHWSHGSFGYFPTYSLGSFYAAQFYAAAKKTLPGLEENLAGGNTAPLLQWLRTEIHSRGRLYSSEELCKMVTGEPLNVDYFLSYLLEKYGAIYTL